MNIFISQPVIGRTTEEILKEYREIMDWCKDKFSNQKQHKDNCRYKNNDIKFINPPIPPLSPYKDELIKWFLMVDVAVFAKGWESERDCIMEHHICNNYGIPIYELYDGYCICQRKETKNECLYFTAYDWVDQ